jgi:hypothetical protein
MALAALADVRLLPLKDAARLVTDYRARNMLLVLSLLTHQHSLCHVWTMGVCAPMLGPCAAVRQLHAVHRACTLPARGQGPASSRRHGCTAVTYQHWLSHVN